MSRRTDKKKQRRAIDAQSAVQTAAVKTPVAQPAAEAVVTEAVAPVAEVAAPVEAKPAYDLYIQYQSGEYDAAVLADKILEKCKTEGMDSSDLKIYVKPEDKKAYYACAGGTGAIELA